MINKYFQDNYMSECEQNLFKSLHTEVIQQKGYDIQYILREQDNIEYLYNEDPSQYYKYGKTIEMYPTFVEGFDGGEFMTQFGNEFAKTGHFIVSKERFHQEFPNLIRPREGDILYMPVTNAFLEIRYVDVDSPFFERGEQYVYELKCQVWSFSHEDFQSGNDDIDNNFDDYIKVNEPDSNTNRENGYINDEIEKLIDHDDKGEGVIEFDPTNPFGNLR